MRIVLKLVGAAVARAVVLALVSAGFMGVAFAALLVSGGL